MFGAEIHVDDAIRGLAAMGKQIRFANANALNDLAYEARNAERSTAEGALHDPP